MIDFIKSFKSLIKLDQIHTDNNVFKLHYKFTVIMLVVFCLVLSSKLIFGEQIECLSDSSKVDKDFANSYCWMQATYVLNATSRSLNQLFAGLGNEMEYDEPVVWQNYYQWTCLVFCIQSLSFYIPRYIWKSWEGRRLSLLVNNLGGPLVPDEWTPETKERLVKYLIQERHPHNLYTLRYTFCEFLNLFNVIAQFFLTNQLLRGHFTYFGWQKFFAPEKTNIIFSKVAKCVMGTIGASGTAEKRDFLCILPLNLFNEKLFLILWYWYVILAVMTIMAIIYRIFVLCSEKVRIYVLSAQLRTIGWSTAALIVKKMSYGDFFMLYNIGKNINGIIYHELITALFSEVKKRKDYHDFSESFLNSV